MTCIKKQSPATVMVDTPDLEGQMSNISASQAATTNLWLLSASP